MIVVFCFTAQNVAAEVYRGMDEWKRCADAVIHMYIASYFTTLHIVIIFVAVVVCFLLLLCTRWHSTVYNGTKNIGCTLLLTLWGYNITQCDNFWCSCYRLLTAFVCKLTQYSPTMGQKTSSVLYYLPSKDTTVYIVMIIFVAVCFLLLLCARWYSTVLWWDKNHQLYPTTYPVRIPRRLRTGAGTSSSYPNMEPKKRLTRFRLLLTMVGSVSEPCHG